MSVSQLARLCAGSVDYHSVGSRGFGSSLSKSEIAGLLAGLDPLPLRFAQAKYMGDLESEVRLIEMVQGLVKARADIEGWQFVDGRPCLNNLAAVAVFEVIRPNVCVNCGGSKFVGVKLCTRCNGNGHSALSGRRIASAIGVSQTQYCAVWRARYQSVYESLQDIDNEIVLFVYKNSLEEFEVAA